MKLCVVAALLVPLAWGAAETELKDGDGKSVIRYVVEAPEGVSAARSLGLFLCFPEHDHATGDELPPVRESLRRLGLSDRYVLIAGHPQAQKFGPADHAPIATLIQWAMKTYPIDPRRVYMYGKGEGAKISAEFTAAHPEIVTAAIGYSWGWWMMPSEVDKPIDMENSAPEFYMVLGMRDLATHIATVRDTYGRVRAKGYHVIYREIDDLGARTYHPPTNDDAIAWATRLRNKNIAPSAAEMGLLAKTPVAANGYFEGLAQVGGAPAGAMVRTLLAAKQPAVRAAAAETCSHAIFDERTAAALGTSARDTDSRVRRAALNALAMYAGWRSAAAQKGLMELAADSGNPERTSAVDGIGQAVRFQVRGVRQDPALFGTLIALLNDKDEDVRTMAANILAPIRDSDFRGDAGRPEKKAPEGGWPQWLDGVSAKEAGYATDYEVCKGERTEAVALFCKGEDGRDPQGAFQNTLKAAEMGFVPAEAALGMMYANGKGVQQDYAEAGKWWAKAGAGGHALAAANAARAPKATPAIPKLP